MRLTPDLDTGPAQLGRGGVCEGCAAEPLALLQRREKQAAARHPVGRVWPFSRRRPVRLTACGRLVGGEQPGGLQSSEQHEATGERTASANTALRKGGEWAFKVVLESCERGRFSQSTDLQLAPPGDHRCLQSEAPIGKATVRSVPQRDRPPPACSCAVPFHSHWPKTRPRPPLIPVGALPRAGCRSAPPSPPSTAISDVQAAPASGSAAHPSHTPPRPG